MCHADDVCVCVCVCVCARVNTDVNECEDDSLCLGGQCANSIGSYSCFCPAGLELVDGTSCRGIHTHTHTHTGSSAHLTHKIYN